MRGGEGSTRDGTSKQEIRPVPGGEICKVAGVFDVVLADLRAAQLREVGGGAERFAQIAGKGSDVGAAGTLDARVYGYRSYCRSYRPYGTYTFELSNTHFARRAFDFLALAS